VTGNFVRDDLRAQTLIDLSRSFEDWRLYCDDPQSVFYDNLSLTSRVVLPLVCELVNRSSSKGLVMVGTMSPLCVEALGEWPVIEFVDGFDANLFGRLFYKGGPDSIGDSHESFVLFAPDGEWYAYSSRDVELMAFNAPRNHQLLSAFEGEYERWGALKILRDAGKC